MGVLGGNYQGREHLSYLPFCNSLTELEICASIKRSWTQVCGCIFENKKEKWSKHEASNGWLGTELDRSSTPPWSFVALSECHIPCQRDLKLNLSAAWEKDVFFSERKAGRIWPSICWCAGLKDWLSEQCPIKTRARAAFCPPGRLHGTGRTMWKKAGVSANWAHVKQEGAEVLPSRRGYE